MTIDAIRCDYDCPLQKSGRGRPVSIHTNLQVLMTDGKSGVSLQKMAIDDIVLFCFHEDNMAMSTGAGTVLRVEDRVQNATPKCWRAEGLL